MRYLRKACREDGYLGRSLLKADNFKMFYPCSVKITLQGYFILG